VRAASVLPTKLSSSQPMSFLPFTLPSLSPVLLEGNEQAAGWAELPTHLPALTHDTALYIARLAPALCVAHCL